MGEAFAAEDRAMHQPGEERQPEERVGEGGLPLCADVLHRDREEQEIEAPPGPREDHDRADGAEDEGRAEEGRQGDQQPRDDDDRRADSPGQRIAWYGPPLIDRLHQPRANS